MTRNLLLQKKILFIFKLFKKWKQIQQFIILKAKKLFVIRHLISESSSSWGKYKVCMCRGGLIKNKTE